VRLESEDKGIFSWKLRFNIAIKADLPHLVATRPAFPRRGLPSSTDTQQNPDKEAGGERYQRGVRVAEDDDRGGPATCSGSLAENAKEGAVAL